MGSLWIYWNMIQTMQFTYEELEIIKISLKAMLETLSFLRGFGEKTDKEKIIEELIKRMSNQP
jgi:hypothetical protein